MPQRLEFGGFVIDNGGRSVTLNDELVDFTSAENMICCYWYIKCSVVLSREDIFERLRGIEYDGQDRSIDVRTWNKQLKLKWGLPNCLLIIAEVMSQDFTHKSVG